MEVLVTLVKLHTVPHMIYSSDFIVVVNLLRMMSQVFQIFFYKSPCSPLKFLETKTEDIQNTDLSDIRTNARTYFSTKQMHY